jgi:hypothetical protein
MHRTLTVALICLATVFGFFAGTQNSNRFLQNEPQLSSNDLASVSPRPKVWISMSLCFSETTEKHGKKNYPYVDVTLLSILLWNYFFGNDPGKNILT